MKKSFIFSIFTILLLASCSSVERKPASACEEHFFQDKERYFENYERCSNS